MRENGVRYEGRLENKSKWWRDVLSLVEGEGGRWLWEILENCLGDGGSTSFWHGLWVGPRTLKSVFPRLFGLSLDKEASIREFGE